MTTTILVIVFAIFCIAVGYKLAVIRWNPKDLIDRLEKYNSINQNLTEGVKKLDETVKMNSQWYMSQIQFLAQYLKEKHNDNYVFEKMKDVEGFKNLDETQENYNVDDILDKISISGWTSLNENEINFLKKQK